MGWACFLVVGTINMWGQKGFKIECQRMLEDWVKSTNLDIVMCQETNITEDTFNGCSFIKENYSIISNNSLSKYGM